VTLNSQLDRVERLLDEALEDLKRPKGEAPAVRCAAALAEAARELQTFSQVRPEPGSHSSAFRARLAGVPAKLRRLERLLASAAEFYTGWCAAGTQADSYPAPGDLEQGYQSAGWSNPAWSNRGPALLAFRG
jgi:hypothetical protein